MELAHMRRDVTYCVSWNGVGVSSSKYGACAPYLELITQNVEYVRLVKRAPGAEIMGAFKRPPPPPPAGGGNPEAQQGAG